MEIQRNKKASYSLPKCGLIMGAPKVGKSTFLASDDKTLIVDLEPSSDNGEGAYFGINVAGGYTNPSTLDELYEVLKFYFSEENTEYTILAIDHIREVTTFFSKAICSMAGVDTVADIGYGKGTATLKHDIEKFIKHIIKKSTISKRVILVGHATDRNGEVRLDVDGKNETLIFGLVDYVGYLYRSGPELHINFTQSTGSEYGCRNKYLAMYKGIADLNILKEVANGPKEEK